MPEKSAAQYMNESKMTKKQVWKEGNRQKKQEEDKERKKERKKE